MSNELKKFYVPDFPKEDMCDLSEFDNRVKKLHELLNAQGYLTHGDRDRIIDGVDDPYYEKYHFWLGSRDIWYRDMIYLRDHCYNAINIETNQDKFIVLRDDINLINDAILLEKQSKEFRERDNGKE